jgi:hypothetical protein
MFRSPVSITIRRIRFINQLMSTKCYISVKWKTTLLLGRPELNDLFQCILSTSKAIIIKSKCWRILNLTTHCSICILFLNWVILHSGRVIYFLSVYSPSSFARIFGVIDIQARVQVLVFCSFQSNIPYHLLKANP